MAYRLKIAAQMMGCKVEELPAIVVTRLEVANSLVRICGGGELTSIDAISVIVEDCLPRFVEIKDSVKEK